MPLGALIEWDLTTAEQKPLWVKKEGLGQIADLRFAGDELRVASVLPPREKTAETIRVWRARDGVTLREVPAPVPLRPSSLWVMLYHGGERLGVSRYGPFNDSPPSADPNEATVWNVTGEDRPLRFPYAPPGPYGVGLTPDGRRALVVGRQGGDLYDTVAGIRVASFLFPKVPGNAPANADVKVADLSPDGRRVLYANGQHVVLMDAFSGNELVVLNQSVVPKQSVWSADGRVIAVLGRDGHVYVWDGTPLAENPPPDPKVLFDLAWELATHPDPKQRDGTAAVRLAKQAVERMPSYANGWLALGAAEYRTGNYASAIEALKKALDRKPAAPGRVKFFLAMANARLGLAVEAKRWFDEAVKEAEAEKGSARVDELRRLRTEAEPLLAARQ